MVIWFESHRVAVFGDTLVDFGDGLQIHPIWLPAGVTHEQVESPLRELLQLEPQHVLATHGGPHTRTDLRRALAHDPSA